MGVIPDILPHQSGAAVAVEQAIVPRSSGARTSRAPELVVLTQAKYQ